MPIPTSSHGDSQAPRAPGSDQHAGPSHVASSETGEREGGKATGAGVDTGAGTTRDKTEAEKEADRLYEEAMEDEYAKRDGGA
jgi:hypothetical protein